MESYHSSMPWYAEPDGQISFRNIFDEQARSDRNAYRLHNEVIRDLTVKGSNFVVTSDSSNPGEARLIFPGGKKIGKITARSDGIYYKGTVLDDILEPLCKNGVILAEGSTMEKRKMS
jgi:hypothetical protein